MDVYAKLMKEAERANREQDLPDVIFEQIKEICADSEKYSDTELIEELTERLEDYEPFADVGCGNESYSTADVKKAIEKILTA
jgi:hypothetical protein